MSAASPSADERSARLVERTRRLCQVASPIGEEDALCTELQRWAESLYGKSRVTRLGNSFVAIGDVATAPALAGHLDTVPFFPGDGPVRIEGDRLHGKGSSDMKSGIAVALELCETLPPGRRPTLLLYEREEGPYDQNGLGKLFEAGLVPNLSLAICLEPTDGALQLGCLGSLHATLRFVGKRAHSARPWEGKNAVHAGAEVLARIAARAPHEVAIDGLTFHEVAQVTRASGGTARNVLPDSFELNLNYRFAPGRSLDEAQADVQALARGADEIVFTDLSPSGPTCRSNRWVQRLLALGVTAAAKQAWTDVARFGAHGIDAVNFGPGQPAQAHQVDEWCAIPSMGRAYEVLWRLFADDA